MTTSLLFNFMELTFLIFSIPRLVLLMTSCSTVVPETTVIVIGSAFSYRSSSSSTNQYVPGFNFSEVKVPSLPVSAVRSVKLEVAQYKSCVTSSVSFGKYLNLIPLSVSDTSSELNFCSFFVILKSPYFSFRISGGSSCCLYAVPLPGEVNDFIASSKI